MVLSGRPLAVPGGTGKCEREEISDVWMIMVCAWAIIHRVMVRYGHLIDILLS